MRNPRIEQCKADIDNLQEELKRLESALPPRHGDIVQSYYCDETGIEGRRIILIADGHAPKSYNMYGVLQLGKDDTDAVAYAYTTGDYVVIGNVFDPEDE